MTKKWDVLALGNVAVDDFLYVPHYPPPDTKMRVLASQRQCGGLAATALVAASRLGARCAYAGVLGENELSRFAESTLAREGIDLSHVVKRDDASPTHSRIVVAQNSGSRNVFNEKCGACGADENLPNEGVIRASRVLLVDPWGEAGTLRAARIARENSIPIVADLERDNFDTFEELFSLSDHLIVSQEFAFKRTAQSAPQDAVKALWNEERHSVVVTCGARGSWAISKEYSDCAPRHHAAFEVEAVDTTGCGDVFHGAYACGLAQGLNLDVRLRLASATAAMKAMRRGGQSGIPTRAEVEEFLLRFAV